MSLCKCEDSRGVKCLKPMTKQEEKQDGMCQSCADNVWEEINGRNSHWENQNKPKTMTLWQYAYQDKKTGKIKISGHTDADYKVNPFEDCCHTKLEWTAKEFKISDEL